MEEETLEKNRLAGHSEIEEEATGKNRLAGHSKKEEKIENINTNISEICFLN